MDGKSPLDRQRLSRVLELLGERVDVELLRLEFPDLTGEDVRGLFQALGEHLRYCQEWLDSTRNNQGKLETQETSASLYCDGASRGNPGPSGAGVVKQLRGEYKVKNPRLQYLYDKTMSRLKQFDDYVIFHVGRELNQQADRLANDAIDRGLAGGAREKYNLAQRE